VSEKVVDVGNFDCFWDLVMAMKTASCILGPVNTLMIILKNLIEPVLFWAELHKQHYSLETTMYCGIFQTLWVRWCAPHSSMNKVQVYCWSKVCIIEALFRFGCDSFLTEVVFSRLLHQTRIGTLNSIFETSAETIGSFWLTCTIRLLVLNTKPFLYFVMFDLHFTKNPLPGLFTCLCFSLTILFRPVVIALYYSFFPPWFCMTYHWIYQ